MPSGGARVGSGPKPKRVVDMSVLRGRVEDSDVSLIPPEDLDPSGRAFWQEYAPLGIEMRTLTRHTVPAFRLLCVVAAESDRLRATLDEDGRTFVKVTVDGAGQEHQELKAHPLMSHYSKIMKQIEVLMGRFMLAPVGKPLAVRDKTPTEAENDRFFARR